MNLLGIVALSILAVGYATDWEAGLKAEDLAIRRWRKGDLTQRSRGYFHREILKFSCVFKLQEMQLKLL